MSKLFSRKVTSFSVARESRTPEVISSVLSVRASGSSPSRNSLRMNSLTIARILPKSIISVPSILPGAFCPRVQSQVLVVEHRRIKTFGDQLVALGVGMRVPRRDGQLIGGHVLIDRRR